MAERTLAENAAQAISDFKEIKEFVNTQVQDSIPDGTPTSRYGALIETALTASKALGRDEGYAEGELSGIEQGKQAEYDAFWDMYQCNGDRDDYTDAFKDTLNEQIWSKGNFKVKYPLKLRVAQDIFANLGRAEDKPIDLVEFCEEHNIILDYRYPNSGCDWRSAFMGSNISHVPHIKVGTYGLHSAFNSAKKLVTIDELELCTSTPSPGSAFQKCSNLKNITFSGKPISENGWSFSQSSLLTHESLMSFINLLADKTGDTSGTVWKITLGSANKAKLTAKELAVAENKGWTVA